jgi:predicted porin
MENLLSTTQSSAGVKGETVLVDTIKAYGKIEMQFHSLLT